MSGTKSNLVSAVNPPRLQNVTWSAVTCNKIVRLTVCRVLLKVFLPTNFSKWKQLTVGYKEASKKVLMRKNEFLIVLKRFRCLKYFQFISLHTPSENYQKDVLRTLDSRILLNSPNDLSTDPTRLAGQGPDPCDCNWRLRSLTIFWSLWTQTNIELQRWIVDN